MATPQPLERSDGDARESRLLLSRQPVIDGRDRVVGYRLAYALLREQGPVVPSASEAYDLLDDLLSVIGKDEQVQGSLAHLSLTRPMLLEQGLPPVPGERMLLRVSYADAIEPSVQPVLDRAAELGFELELDELPGPDFDRSLLSRFDAVEFDVAEWENEELAAALKPILARDIVAVAVNVHDHVQREQARALGFEWFVGSFFATPNLVGGKAVPVGDMRSLVELTRLQGSDDQLEQLVAVIERDLGLGMRLLRYINSAYFGLAGRVRSIGYAAAMLGAKALSRWALIVAALDNTAEIPRELQLLALTRARTCELVGIESGDRIASDELFTIGLLSTVDAMFRMPIEAILAELPLTDEVENALAHYTGPAGEILGSLVSYERGDFRDPALRDDLLVYAAAYRAGLEWARDALGGLD
jgi:EAL and modified HD-GYP domain-containing signal transduction protein